MTERPGPRLSVANGGDPGNGPLAGVRVLSIERGSDLSLATQLMAEMGAQVVAIRDPSSRGSSDDPWVAAARMRSEFDLARTSGGKWVLNIALEDEGIALIPRLIHGFDMFAENAGRGVLESMGLGYRDLVQRAPALVYLSLSAFGRSDESPYVHWPSTSTTIEAMAGFYSIGLHDRDDRPAVSTPHGFANVCAAAFGVIGAMAGLRQSELASTPTYLDISRFDSAVAMNDGAVTIWSMGAPRERLSGRGAGIKANFRARDGFFTIVVLRRHMWERFAKFMNQPHWITLGRYATPSDWTDATEPEIRPVVESWARDLTKFEASTMLADEGIVAGPCLSPHDLLTDPHISRRRLIQPVGDNPREAGMYSVATPVFWSQYTPPAKWRRNFVADRVIEDVVHAPIARVQDRTGTKRTTSTVDVTPAAGPLHGIRILAVEHMLSLPYGTQILRRLGADVLKVEPVGVGESGRAAYPSVPDREGAAIGSISVRAILGKQSIAVNLKDSDGIRIIKRLLPEFDVFAQNMRPGVLDSLGLGYEAVRAVSPQTVYASVSGFGNHIPSPYRHWPAYAPIAESMAGYVKSFAPDSAPPTPSQLGPVGDLTAGVYGALAILSALRIRDRTGLGGYVDVAMFDTTLAYNEAAISTPHPALGVHQAFRCGDGFLFIAIDSRRAFEELSRLVGHPEWVVDDSLNSPDTIADHVESKIRPAVEDWLRSRSRLDAAATLCAIGIPAGPCNAPEDLSLDRHLLGRQMIRRVEGVVAKNPVLVVGNPIRIVDRGNEIDGPVPTVGQDAYAVLTGVCGMTECEIAELVERGVVGA